MPQPKVFTPKAFANSSPGFLPWDHERNRWSYAEGVGQHLRCKYKDRSPWISQGRNPGLEFANAFGVKDFSKILPGNKTFAIGCTEKRRVFLLNPISYEN